MADLFPNFMAGFERGSADMLARRQRNALSNAATRYRAGDVGAARNALLQEGMLNEATAYDQMGEVERARRVRTNAANAWRGAGNNPQAQAQAVAQVYGQEGDIEQAMAVQNAGIQRNQLDRATFTQDQEFLASRIDYLKGLPMEQRGQAAIQAIQGTPFDTPQMRQIIEAAAADGRMTNEELDGWGQAVIPRMNQVAQAEDTRRWEASHALDVRRTSAAERAASAQADPNSRPLTNTETRVLANEYRNASQTAVDSLGILRPSIPYARLAVANNGDTTELGEGVNFRQSDVALLRAAARAQTGPGVLTESEVFGTLSPSLQQDLNRQKSYYDISQSGLEPADRLALAEFVMQSARNVQREAWDIYDGYDAQWGTNPTSPNFRPPRIPHPEDEEFLQEQTRRGVQQATSPGGRIYQNVGNGNWETTGVGEPPPAPVSGVAWGGIPPQHQQELIANANNPEAIASFNRRYGDGAAQRVLSGGFGR